MKEFIKKILSYFNGFLKDDSNRQSSTRLNGLFVIGTLCISQFMLTYAAMTSSKDFSFEMVAVITGMCGLAGFNYNAKSKRESEEPTLDEPKD